MSNAQSVKEILDQYSFALFETTDNEDIKFFVSEVSELFIALNPVIEIIVNDISWSEKKLARFQEELGMLVVRESLNFGDEAKEHFFEDKEVIIKTELGNYRFIPYANEDIL